MQHLPGYIKFGLAIHKTIQDILPDPSTEEWKAVRAALSNHLFDSEEKQHASINFKRDEYVAIILFSGFGEIRKSFGNLRDIEIYVRRFPYGNTDISRVRYLQYHIENYLNEVYILQQRLDTFLTKIERKYKRMHNIQEIKIEFKKYKDIINSALGEIVRIRGGHVHDLRFQNEDIDKLEMLELLSDASDPLFSMIYQEEYTKIRKEWTLRIKYNNNNTGTLLDDYFDMLHVFLFDEESGLIYPDSG